MPGIRRKVSTQEEGCRPGQPGRILAAATRATCFLGAARDAWMAGCWAGRVGILALRAPGMKPRSAPPTSHLALRRRALLRGRPRPWAHSSAGAAGRRRDGNSSGSHRLNLGG